MLIYCWCIMICSCKSSIWKKNFDISFIYFVFISCPTPANLREISSAKFRPFPCKVSPMLDQAPCGPAVPCLSRQARAAVMVRLRGEADAGHRSAVSGHRSPVKQVIGRQCHSGVSVIRVNTGMVNFRKFLLPNKAVIFLKIFREIYICPNSVCNTH